MKRFRRVLAYVPRYRWAVAFGILSVVVGQVLQNFAPQILRSGLREIEDGFIGRVMGCHALQEDGSCGEYRLRPVVCRAFPELPLTGKPLLLKGCGYSFERRDGRPDRELVQIGSPRRLQP